MTLKDKVWLENEIFRLYLSGDFQESIANSLNISVGTVNSLVSEMLISDDTIELQRQIAIVAKKNGVEIKGIAANLRWKNLIKRSSLDDRKVEKFLDAMDSLFNKYSIPLSTAANRLFSIIEIMQRDNIEPDRLEEQIKSRVVESQTLDAQIEAKRKNLEQAITKVENKQKELRIKDKDLDQFHQVSQMLKLYEFPEFSIVYGEVARAMINFKRQGYDPKAIVSLFGKSENLITMKEKMETELQEMEKVQEFYRRRQEELESKWKDNYDALAKFNSLIKDGLSVEYIFMVVHLIKNDFPNMDIHQIIEEIKSFGSIMATRLKQQRIFEIQAGTMFEDLR